MSVRSGRGSAALFSIAGFTPIQNKQQLLPSSSGTGVALDPAAARTHGGAEQEQYLLASVKKNLVFWSLDNRAVLWRLPCDVGT